MTVFVLFILLNSLVQNQFVFQGNVLDQWRLNDNGVVTEVTMPFSNAVNQPGWRSMETSAVIGDYDALVIPQLYCYGIKVYVDNGLVYQVGSTSTPTANLWNTTHLVALDKDLYSGTSIIRIESYSYHDIGINAPVVLTDSDLIAIRVQFQNLVNVWMVFVIMGCYLSLGIIFLFMTLSGRKHQGHSWQSFFYFSILCFSLIGYLFDTAYRTSTFSPEMLLVFRKFSFICLFISLWSLVVGIRRYVYSRQTHWLLAAAILPVILIIVFLPDTMSLYRFSGILVSLAFLLILYTVYVCFRSDKAVLSVGAVFFLFTSTQSTFLQMSIVSGIYLTHYGVLVFMFIFAYLISNSYSELENLSDQLSDRLLIDPMTKAYNRSYLTGISLDEKDRVMFLDMDRFKSFNDTYGHEVGDRLLIRLVGLFRDLLGHQIEIIRYGGDEFVVVFRGKSETDVLQQIERIRSHLQQEYPEADFSYGFINEENSFLESLLEADRRMYMMKRDKKGTS